MDAHLWPEVLKHGHSSVSQCSDECPAHCIICLDCVAGKAMQGGRNVHVIEEGCSGGVLQQLQPLLGKALQELGVIEALRAANPREVDWDLQHRSAFSKRLLSPRKPRALQPAWATCASTGWGSGEGQGGVQGGSEANGTCNMRR